MIRAECSIRDTNQSTCTVWSKVTHTALDIKKVIFNTKFLNIELSQRAQHTTTLKDEIPPSQRDTMKTR